MNYARTQWKLALLWQGFFFFGKLDARPCHISAPRPAAMPHCCSPASKLGQPSVLSDEQWERIRKHFPEEHIPDGRAGRKPIPTRHVLEAVLWILNTGAQWHMLPQSYPNYKTVHRRFQTWCCHEILRLVLTDVANELRENGALDEEECFIDATFVMAKGGGAAANHHEVRLVQLCFDFAPHHPRLSDRARHHGAARRGAPAWALPDILSANTDVLSPRMVSLIADLARACRPRSKLWQSRMTAASA